MFNFFKTQSELIDSETLKEILNEIISPRLKMKGFMWDNNFKWFSDNQNSIRHILQYRKLKGGQATLNWGICLDFVPAISGQNLTFNRTEKNMTLHLFEWTDEYSSSFFGGQLEGGVSTEWGKSEATKSISTLFDKYEDKIFNWFDKTKNLEDILQVANFQILTGGSYQFHGPNPSYILPFLQSKTGQIEQAILTLDKLYNLSEGSKIKEKLINVIKKNGTQHSIGKSGG
jgi:hypothetical protein